MKEIRALKMALKKKKKRKKRREISWGHNNDDGAFNKQNGRTQNAQITDLLFYHQAIHNDKFTTCESIAWQI